MKTITLGLATLASLAATMAHADRIVGLTVDNTLIMFDAADPSVMQAVTVSGTGTLVGIDYRPADGMLYAVTDMGEILTIDIASASGTLVSTTDTMLPITGPVAMDFNPMADRLRLMSGTTNHRIHPDTGETTVDGSLAFAADGPHAGEMPMITATAYLNAFGAPESTAQYNIDASMHALVQQIVPNDGVLQVVGPLGIEADTYAFDIQTAADGTNTAWLLADDRLYTVSLETGMVNEGWDVMAPGQITDITVMPAM